MHATIEVYFRQGYVEYSVFTWFDEYIYYKVTLVPRINLFYGRWSNNPLQIEDNSQRQNKTLKDRENAKVDIQRAELNNALSTDN